jgi:hypothetical protein
MFKGNVRKVMRRHRTDSSLNKSGELRSVVSSVSLFVSGSAPSEGGLRVFVRAPRYLSRDRSQNKRECLKVIFSSRWNCVCRERQSMRLICAEVSHSHIIIFITILRERRTCFGRPSLSLQGCRSSRSELFESFIFVSFS